MDGRAGKVVSKENLSHLQKPKKLNQKVEASDSPTHFPEIVPALLIPACSSCASRQIESHHVSTPLWVPAAGGQLSWWVREARTLPGPTLGRIGRLAQTRPPGEQVTGHRGHDGQVGGGRAAAAAQLPLLLQELGMEPVLQWATPRRTGSLTKTTSKPYSTLLSASSQEMLKVRQAGF